MIHMTDQTLNTRERFVTATLALLRQGGVSAAGLSDVVALARAPKGSLYHYFPQGKSQMVVQAVDRYRELVNELLAASLGTQEPLSKRVARLFRDVAQRMAKSSFNESCAVGAVVLDLRSEDDTLRAACQTALAQWAETAAMHLQELPSSKRVEAGRLLVNLLEGAQLSSRAAGHGGPLAEAADCFMIYLQAIDNAASRSTLPTSKRDQKKTDDQ